MDDIAKAYTVLELEPGASLSDVNQAYKDLVFIWHPDRIPADNTRLRDKAQDKLKRLNNARSRLKQHLRDDKKGSSQAEKSKKSSNYNPERYGSSRYRSYSRYTRPYGYSSSGTTTAQNGSRRSTDTYRSDNGWANSGRASYGHGSATANGNGAENGAAATNGSAAANGNGAKNGSANGYSADDRHSVTNSNRVANSHSPTASSSQGNGKGPASSSGTRSSKRDAAAHSSMPRPVTDGYADYIYQVPQPTPYTPPQKSPARRNPDLEGSDFKGANLKEKDFSGRNLSKSNLEGADLSDAFLHKVNLNQANLHKAKLFRANLLQANLSHANLREANLIGADLSGADLSGADLSGAIVGYGDKIMVKLTAARLTGAIMPNGNIHE